MPRKSREHEDYLESVEPVGVVVLNDVSYLLQDVSEIVLDLGKLLKHRRDEVMDFLEKVKGGPDALPDLLPPEILEFLMGSAGDLAGKGMELKEQVTPDAEEGEAPAGGLSVDIEKIQPNMLEELGTMIREKAEALEGLVADFEKNLLEENPPS